MIPQGGILGKVTQTVRQPGRTYRIDPGLKRILGMVDGLEAVKQAALKILATERFEHIIYSGNYGSEFSNIPGRSPSFVQTELNRRIREALLQDDRIKDIQHFEVEINGDDITASFTVVSLYGSVALTKGVGESV
ncbi:DUF2634 domain-containing protein [Paenibacillus vulneris]|uniref:DUF2634 domain-containing protein n=1 Tax=Paenibacillus vulneris TaxID=1133364 RepID=A0ABW3UM11_9BACL|nr:DUF2634 domain-containing protein [Paenibacillus sp. 32352]